MYYLYVYVIVIKTGPQPNVHLYIFVTIFKVFNLIQNSMVTNSLIQGFSETRNCGDPDCTDGYTLHRCIHYF